MENNYFRIADHNICIRFTDTTVNGTHLLPSYEPFRTDDRAEEQMLFTLTVDDTLLPVHIHQVLRECDTGNGITYVFSLPDGGYQFIVHDVRQRSCCLLISNKDFSECRCALKGDKGQRMFGLNDALMLTFAFASSFHRTLLLHASCVKYGDTCYPFTAKSGTGKSTHAALWMKHIENVELLNDDNPVVRIDNDGTAHIYGSPWSGKTPCYRNLKLKLGAITEIKRDSRNWAERLTPADAMAMMLPNLSSMKWDHDIYRRTGDTVARLIENVPIFTMHCRPDEEAARVSYQTLTTAS